MLNDVFTQLFPVIVQWLVANAIEVFFVGVDGQDTFGVGGLIEHRTTTGFLRQFVGRFEQVVLNRFKGAVREVVGTAV